MVKTPSQQPQGFSARLSKSFPEPVGSVLQEFAISCSPGEIVSLVGTSGCGKTTLLNQIAQFLGSKDRDGPNLAFGDYCYGFQRAEVVPWRNCEGNAYFEIDVLGKLRTDVRALVDQLFNLTGLEPYRTLYPNQLSVGMQQRLQLVRIAARQARIILLDEPLGAVDQPLRILLAEHFRALFKSSGSTVVWVTHDTLEAVAVSDRILVLGGRPLRSFSEHIVQRSEREDGPQFAQSHPSGLSSIDAQAMGLRLALVNISKLPVSNSKTSTINNNGNSPAILSARVPPRDVLFAALPAILGLVIWEIAGAINPAFRFFISTPSEWIPRLFEEVINGQLLSDTLTTLREATAGLALGMSFGVASGYFAGSSRSASLALRPYLVGLTAVPLFVLAPAFILWFGIGESMKVAIAALSCFPFVGFMVHDSAVQAKGDYYHHLLRSGASPGLLFKHLLFPSTLEGIILSIRPASVSALIGAFLGEFIAADRGLGYYIVLQASRYHVAEVFAGVSILFAIAIVVDWVSRVIGSRRDSLVGKLQL